MALWWRPPGWPSRRRHGVGEREAKRPGLGVGLGARVGVVVGCLAVSLSAAASPPPATPLAADPPKAERNTIWQGCTGVVCVRWTGDDIVAASHASPEIPMFSLAAELRAVFGQEQRRRRNEAEAVGRERSARGEAPPQPNPCTQDIRAAILSLVGGFLSVQATITTSCERAAHPAGETKFITFDFTDAAPASGVHDGAASETRQKRATLGDLFAADPVIAAFRGDPLVGRAIADTGPVPKTLQALQEAMGAAPEIIEAQGCYAFASDQLARFAFHHIEGDKVAVRIGLPGAGPCRENLTQVGLLLPIPPALAAALTGAETLASGFLMQSAPGIAHGRIMARTFAPLL